MNWLFWLQGSAPYLGGGFGHFYAYAPEKFEYKRQLDVLDKQLAKHRYIAGDEYSIADMAIWPWYGNLVLGRLYDAAKFLDVDGYVHLQRWAKEIDARPAVARGPGFSYLCKQCKSNTNTNYYQLDYALLFTQCVQLHGASFQGRSELGASITYLYFNGTTFCCAVFLGYGHYAKSS